MKNKYLYTLLAVFITAISLGQAVPPPIPPPPPPGLPIDGGLIFLLIAGLLFGVRKLRQR